MASGAAERDLRTHRSQALSVPSRSTYASCSSASHCVLPTSLVLDGSMRAVAAAVLCIRVAVVASALAAGLRLAGIAGWWSLVLCLTIHRTPLASRAD